ncbi:MAG: hypothetical protein N2572_01715 [Syntrophales bacterium]|nr:hypothetical protein [Syntrophales bacterium]
MGRLIFHRNVLLPLAIILGFLYPGPSSRLIPFVIPILAVAMVMASVHIPNSIFEDIKRLLNGAWVGLVMTYGVLGVFLTLAGFWGPFPEKVGAGLVLIGISPPAVAVMPFTAALKGDLSFTLAGMVVSYLGALLIIPLALFVILGSGNYNVASLISILFWVVIVPIALSRLILFLRWEERIKSIDGPVTNASFFLVLYAIVGMNRGAFLAESAFLLPLMAVAFFSTFLMGEIVNLAGKVLKVGGGKRISAVLMATLKNQGVAGGLALTLFDHEAALPSAIYAVFMMLSFLWFSFRLKDAKESS